MKYLILLTFLGFSQMGKAQDTIVKYFNNNWEKVSQENAKFYRKSFKNNEGTWSAFDYFMNGQVQMSGTYKTKRLKKKNGLFVFYYKSGVKKSEGKYINDIHDGEWKWYHKNGQISSREEYVEDELKQIEYWNEDGSKVKGKLKQVVFAEYVGGDLALQQYIFTYLIYPRDAQETGVQGRVSVKFIIGLDGEIEKSWIHGYADPLLKDEALRVVNNMPKWIPGKAHNLPVKVSFTIPINFRLK